MPARTLTKDIEGPRGVLWHRGETLDLTWHVWGGICDRLGVTLNDISYPADEANAKMAARIAELEQEIAALKGGGDAKAAPTAKRATKGNKA